MKKIYIIDSGVGGFAVLFGLVNVVNGIHFHYIADTAYAPYGNKTKSELNKRFNFLKNKYIEENDATIILACNSISASIDDNNEQQIIKVKPQFEMSYGKTVLLATSRTCEEYESQTENDDIVFYPMRNLAYEIEKNILDNEKIEKIVKNVISEVEIEKYENVLLGCTHYWFIGNVFEKLLSKTKVVFPKKEYYIDMAKKYFINENDYEKNAITIYVTSNFNEENDKYMKILKKM